MLLTRQSMAKNGRRRGIGCRSQAGDKWKSKEELESRMASESFSYMTNILGESWVENALDEYQEFRSVWSPSERWYHRLPQVSPIVPLLFWNSRADFDDVQMSVRPYEPMGCWAGHPREVLGRLAEEIHHFEGYWKELPEERGKTNLVWALRTPHRFFSLAHELATAFFFDAREGVWVEPLFFDPRASSGKPDILAHTPKRDFAIQCKSQDPTSARHFPYDLWQYFAGVFHRVVHNSGRSIHFSALLKGRLDEKQIRRLARRVSSLVRKGLSTPFPWESSLGSFQLTDMGEFPRAQRLARLRLSAFSQAEPFYDEIIPLPSLVAGRSRCASLSVAGGKGEDVTEFVRRATTSATKAASADESLIVAVHLYHEIDFSEFLDRPLVQSNLMPWSNKYFADNPHLAVIFLSSNFERYDLRLVESESIGIQHGRVGWVMESPVWDHALVEPLGI